MLAYELEILISKKEELPYIEKDGHFDKENSYVYNDLYYGFNVKNVNSSAFSGRVFEMSGESTLSELKTMFSKLTKEVVESETPPKCFKNSVVLLFNLLNQQDEKDFEDNMQYEISRHYSTFGIRMKLNKIPAPLKKAPEPDGVVTGSVWNVAVILTEKETKTQLRYEDHVFCIKPESAVHETLDKMFRSYPDIRKRYEIETPVEVTRVQNETLKFPYVVYPGEEENVT